MKQKSIFSQTRILLIFCFQLFFINSYFYAYGKTGKRLEKSKSIIIYEYKL